MNKIEGRMLKGRILITGGSGFIARGIMRQAMREHWPCSFTVYSRDELKQDLCRQKFPNAEYILGDVRDVEKLGLLFRFHDVVIHAAAAKYVPESAINVNEFIDCNVIGSRMVAMAALAARDLKTVINISTDKAVQPANVYGLTKALAEHVFLEASRYPVGPDFVQVRYGNVIGSTGSVVPMLKRHAEIAGRVRMTDPDSTRFWLTVEDAVDIIDYAVNHANSGDIVVPNPRAMRLVDLLDAILPDVPRDTIGLRPGEKQHETLISAAESVKTRAANSTSALGEFAYVYHPDGGAKHDSPFEITSDVAAMIGRDEFAQLAQEAELV